MATFDLRYAMGKFSMAVQNAVNIVPPVDQGFGNFFGEKLYKTKGFDFFVNRQGRSVAVDINPLERGNINSLNKSTQQFFIPPTYSEGAVYSAYEEFETLQRATDGKIDNEIYRALVDKTSAELLLSRQKIERREELQRAQALLTGIVLLTNGDNIDFKRDSSLLVAYDAAFGWDVDTISPEKILIQLIDAMVTLGAVNANVPLNVIVGAEAFSAFKANPIRQKEGDIRDQKFMGLATGKTSTGGPMKNLTPQGSYSAGNYVVNLWGNNGQFDDPDNSDAPTPYMDTKSIVVLPNTVPFEMVYCGTTGWSDGTGMSPSASPRVIKAKRNIQRFRDIRSVSEEIQIKSAVVASLREVDSVGTAQVVGEGVQG